MKHIMRCPSAAGIRSWRFTKVLVNIEADADWKISFSHGIMLTIHFR